MNAWWTVKVWWWRIQELMSDEFWQENCRRSNQIAYLQQEVKRLKTQEG